MTVVYSTPVCKETQLKLSPPPFKLKKRRASTAVRLAPPFVCLIPEEGPSSNNAKRSEYAAAAASASAVEAARIPMRRSKFIHKPLTAAIIVPDFLDDGAAARPFQLKRRSLLSPRNAGNKVESDDEFLNGLTLDSDFSSEEESEDDELSIYEIFRQPKSDGRHGQAVAAISNNKTTSSRGENPPDPHRP